MTHVVRVPLKERSYDILIGHGLIGKAGAIIRNTAAGKDAVVITNKSIARLFGKKISRSGIKKLILFGATVALLLSGLTPFLSVFLTR